MIAGPANSGPAAARSQAQAFRIAVSLAIYLAAPSGIALGVPSEVAVESTDAGEYLLADGQSLYWNDRDVSTGTPTCLGSCLNAWTPLPAPIDAAPAGAWSVIEHPETGPQWAYRDKPLYTHTEDVFPGARLGDGVGRIWHLQFEPITVPGGMSLQQTLLGRVLADHRGHTLYTKEHRANESPEPREQDRQLFPPLAAPWLALPDRDWTIATNSEGVRQWYYQGKALHTYAKDREAKDILGHGQNGVWTAVVLERAPGVPSWLSAEQTDLGLVYANADGMTIYTPNDHEELKRAQTCPSDCMEEFWRPILAEPHESSIGEWVVIENEEGQRQWSFRGNLLYTHTRDQRPGDMIGNGIGVGYRIGNGFRVILIDPRERPRELN